MMMRRVTFLFALLAVSATSAAGQATPDNTWAPAGPQFSTVLALERDPAVPGTMLAGAYFGGLYRSTDYGFSWTHVTTDFSSRSIFSIAYASSSTIYVGMFRDGVYRSDDGGTTWTPVNNGLTDLDVQSVAADPFNPDVVLAATSNGGVFRSGNRGGSWTRVDDETPGLRGKAIAFDPGHPGVVYLGTIGRGVFRSPDGGLTFEAFSEGITSGSILSLRFGAPPSRELYASTDGGAFKLRRDATIWTDISGNLPPYPLNDLLPHPLVEHLAFAATLVGAYVIANDDVNTSWTAWTNVPTRVMATDPSGSVIHAGSIYGGLEATVDFGHTWYPANWGIQNLFIGALKVVDFGAGGPVVYAGSDSALHRGAYGAWQTFFDQKQGIFDIQSDPSSPGTLYLGSERNGVWKSTDGGAEWTSTSNNLVPAQIYALGQSANGSTMFAGTSSGLYLSPNGEYWALGNASQLGIVLSVAPDPTRAPFLFVGGADGRVLWSEDGGYSYRDASNGLPPENIVSLVTAPWEKTYAITAGGQLFATSDSGHNWFSARSGVPEPAAAIAADPLRSWILYLGTSGGGVYKSESGSLDWTPRNTGLGSPWVFSIAVDPSSPTTVYAGTLEGVFKSVNGAASWTRVSSGLSTGAVTALLVDATNPQVVYAAVQDAGLYRSSNGGQSWASISASLPAAGAMPVLIDRLQPSHLFTGTALNGVYRSANAGASWQPSSLGMTLFVRGLAVDPVTPSTLYAGSLGAGVFKSTDAGGTWTNVGLRDRNIFKLAIDPQHPQTVYAATSRGLNRTTNGGASWSALGQKAAFVYSMVADPRDRRRVFIGTNAGAVYRSVDGGDTWESMSVGLPPRTVYALAIDATTGVLYASLDRKGVWKSTNDGATWTLLSGGQLDQEFVSSLLVGTDHRIYASTVGAGVFIYANGFWANASTGLASPQVSDVEVAPGALLAATLDAGVFRSINGGASWTWASAGLTTSRINSLTIDPFAPTHVYAATPDGVFSSSDAGQTWLPRNEGMRGINTWSVVVDTTNPLRLLAGTNGRGVFVSLDGGTTWAASATGLVNMDVYTIALGPGSGAIYAGTLGGGLARSRDGGTTWSGAVTLDAVDGFMLALAVNPQNPSILYVASAGSGVLKSTNAGVDWKPVTNGLGSLFLLSLAIDSEHPDTVYAGTSDKGVFYTTNGGTSWQALNDGLFNHVITSLAISPVDSTRIYAGTEGGGIFTNHVSLSPPSCTFAPSPTLVSIGSPAAEVTISVSTGSTCGWQVESGAQWLSVVSNVARTGSGSVVISAAINIDQDSRSGLVYVAGQPIVITQQGLLTLYRLSIAHVGTGTGTVTTDWIGINCGADCQQLFTNQLPVVMTAFAAPGSTFVGWEGHPDCADGLAIMGGDRACVARFEQTDDFDEDGLPNLWEAKFGLDAGSAANDDGPLGDPDHDGRTNAEELQEGTHPRGFVTSYFAQGRADQNHDTRVALLNPLDADARVLVRLIPDVGEPVAEYRLLAPMSRGVIDTATLGTPLEGEFAIIIEADRAVVAERTMTQATPHATDAEAAAATLSTIWYSAEGTTRDGRVSRYAIFNPGAAPATIGVAYLPSEGPPVFRTHTVAARGRGVIDIASDAALSGVDVATMIITDQPVVIESTVHSANGDASLTQLASSGPGYLSFLADGRTGPLVSSRVHIFNPTSGASVVNLTYVLEGGGIVQRQHTLGQYSGMSIDPSHEDSLIAAARFGVIVNASAPVVVSGTTWWPGESAAGWYEGGSTGAAPSSGTRWGIADGEVFGAGNSETEISIMNVSPVAGTARVTLVFDDGTSVAREFALPAVGQTRIDVAQAFPEAAWKSFGAVIESIGSGAEGAASIVVEHASYTSPDGVSRSGGTRVGATRLPQ